MTPEQIAEQRRQLDELIRRQRELDAAAAAAKGGR